jgi:uncharacterized membrane protein
MMRWLGPLILALVLAGLAHVGVTVAIPHGIMAIALDRIENAAGGPNRWVHAPRVTAESQNIVRSSPDLAYSTCVADLTAGDVRILVTPWTDYVSAAVYGADTDTVAVLGDREAGPGQPLILTLRAAGRQGGPMPEGLLVEIEGTRALVLVRRLAPGEAAFARADEARRTDVCAPVPNR